MSSKTQNASENLSTSSAQDASGPQGSLTPTRTRTRKANKQEPLPKYGEAEVAILTRFLAAYLTIAQSAKATEQAIYQTDPTNTYFRSRYEYWSHVESAIKWLADNMHRGQQHLLDVPKTEYEAELIKCIKLWQT